jgi:hypothetical protein
MFSFWLMRHHIWQRFTQNHGSQWNRILASGSFVFFLRIGGPDIDFRIQAEFQLGPCGHGYRFLDFTEFLHRIMDLVTLFRTKQGSTQDLWSGNWLSNRTEFHSGSLIRKPGSGSDRFSFKTMDQVIVLILDSSVSWMWIPDLTKFHFGSYRYSDTAFRIRCSYHRDQGSGYRLTFRFEIKLSVASRRGNF